MVISLSAARIEPDYKKKKMLVFAADFLRKWIIKDDRFQQMKFD